MVDIKDDFDQQRQMYSVLVLHFIEGVKQSEIAERLNLSHTKVNRMIAAGRNHAVHLGVGKVEPLGDFGLFHPFDEMQHQDGIHLPLLIEIVLDIHHDRLSPVTFGRADGAQRRRLTR